MGTFILKRVIGGETSRHKVDADRVYDKALSDNGGGMSAKGTADAMLWVSCVRKATDGDPVVMSFTDEDNYVAIYHGELEADHG